LAGAVQTSPRASTTARLPVGEMAQEAMYFAASTAFGRRLGRAPGIVTTTGRAFAVARSSRTSSAPCWKTISPVPCGPGPIAGHFTSWSP
jgi:hypothetical protein